MQKHAGRRAKTHHSRRFKRWIKRKHFLKMTGSRRRKTKAVNARKPAHEKFPESPFLAGADAAR